MKRSFLVVAWLALGLSTSRAQDDPVVGNPLAPVPAWVGAFSDPRVRIEISRSADGFEAKLRVGEQQFPGRGIVRSPTALEGTFRSGEKDFQFTAVLEEPNLLVLSSDGATYRLQRERTVNPLTNPRSNREAPLARSTGPDLSHVRAGQRYVYQMRNPGAPPMAMVYRVTSVRENLVCYEISTIMDMGQGPAPVGPPTSQEWRYEAPSGGREAYGELNVEVSRERVTISGVEFDCMVTTVGTSKSWVPATGDIPTFPGIIKTQTDGNTTMELTRIMSPPPPGPWPERAQHVIGTAMAEDGQDLGRQMLAIVHPSGTFSDASTSTRVDGRSLVLTVVVRWAGGLTAKEYVTTFEWRCSRRSHEGTRVMADSAPIAVGQAESRQLDEWFRTRLYPGLLDELGEE